MPADMIQCRKNNKINTQNKETSMESQRSFLIIGLALVSFLLWQSWQKDYGPQPVVPVEQQQTQETSQGVPSFNENGSEDVPSSDSVPAAQPLLRRSTNRIIEVKTDTLDLRIDLLGGDVVSADLLKSSRARFRHSQPASFRQWSVCCPKRSYWRTRSRYNSVAGV